MTPSLSCTKSTSAREAIRTDAVDVAAVDLLAHILVVEEAEVVMGQATIRLHQMKAALQLLAPRLAPVVAVDADLMEAPGTSAHRHQAQSMQMLDAKRLELLVISLAKLHAT